MNGAFSTAFVIAVLSMISTWWVPVFFQVNQTALKQIEFRSSMLTLFALVALIIRAIFIHGNAVNAEKERRKTSP